MPRKLSLGFAALIGLGAFIGCSKSGSLPAATPTLTSGNTAIVVGGIIPCEGIPIRNGPRYAAGTVTVLRGWPTERNLGHGVYQMVPPRHVVAKTTVKTNGTYRFVLAPGRYTLRGHQFRVGVRPFARVTAKAGKTNHVNIPNMCI